MPPSSTEPSIHPSADKLLALLNIAQRLNAERDLEALLTLIAREAARLLGAELASLFLLDRERNELWSKISFDVEETLRFEATQGIAGEALRTGQAIRVDDVSRDGARALVARLRGRGDNDLYVVDLRSHAEARVTPHELTHRFPAINTAAQ